MTVIGKGVVTGYLAPDEVAGIVRAGLAPMPLDGRRVLVLIPDGTRTMPMPLMFDTLERELLPRVAALDFLVALGTHTPMDDAQARGARGSIGRGWARGAKPDLQPQLERPGDLCSPRHDTGARDRGSDERPPRVKTFPSRSTASPPNTITS